MVIPHNYESKLEYERDLYYEVSETYFKTAQNNIDKFKAKLPGYLKVDELEGIFYIILGNDLKVLRNDTESIRWGEDTNHEVEMENDYMRLQITFYPEDIDEGKVYIDESEVKLEMKGFGEYND